MSQTTIKAMHAAWAAKIVPADAPQIQRQQMERAFYSGVHTTLLWQLHHLAVLPDGPAEQQLQAAHEECETYFKTLAQAPKDIFRS